jgi:hypothetical protein
VGNYFPYSKQTPQPPDQAIALLAARQHGIVTRGQLLDLGLGPMAIHYRVHSGRLHPVHRGVYSVGRPARTGLEHAAAAVLACGPTAALSHQSALVLWAIWERWTFPVQVTIRTGDFRPQGITVHRSRTLAPRDIRRQNGIWTTSPARALLDCAPDLARKTLTRAVNDARLKAGMNHIQLGDVVARNPTHPGAAPLKPFIENTRDGPTRSEWEDTFKDFCARYGLPTPIMSTVVCGFEVDAFFPDHNVIVELDSWEFHKDRSAFEADRERDAETLAHGYHTVRITWERLKTRPADEAARLHRILSRA